VSLALRRTLRVRVCQINAFVEDDDEGGGQKTFSRLELGKVLITIETSKIVTSGPWPHLVVFRPIVGLDINNEERIWVRLKIDFERILSI